MKGTIAVFGASATLPGSAEWINAERCGLLLAAAGYTVTTGGYGGTMEAASVGAASAGGHVIGVTAPSVFLDRKGPNHAVVEEIAFPTLTERLHHLVTMSDGMIVLPGSLGTLAELVAAWNTSFVARFSNADPQIIVTVGDTWRMLVDSLATSLETDRALVVTVDTVDEAVTGLQARLQR